MDGEDLEDQAAPQMIACGVSCGLLYYLCFPLYFSFGFEPFCNKLDYYE